MIRSWGDWDLFQELLDTLKTIGDKHKLSVSNVATRWVLDFPYVGAVIVGARMGISEHTEENIASLGWSLSEEDQQALELLTDNGTGVNACIGHISGNRTLGIPDICMGDGPAGVGNSLNNVTTFPAPVVAASTWNTSLQYAYGQALAREHLGKGRNVVLAPTINILRSPLWARAAETFSEDLWLTARMAVAGVQGIQSEGALACPKHLAAYNQDTSRFGEGPEWVAVDAQVDRRVLHELYLPAFKAAVQEGDAASVMCSYNRLNGYYACENDWLLNQTLRRDWGFEGFVVADWYFSTRSTVGAVMAGLDISMPGGDLTASYGFPDYYGGLLLDAVRKGSVLSARIDDMVARVWRYMFKLGQMDNPALTGDSLAHVRTQQHLDLAQQMVEDGAVLLKNDESTLPLSAAKYAKIAVFGVGATNQSQVSENHGGFVIDSTMVVQAPLDALKRRGAAENISVKGGRVRATYYTTANFTGPVNQTLLVPNITAAAYPADLWRSWPQVFSAVYEGTFLPNATGTHHFSLAGQGTALLYLGGDLVANMSHANFGNTVQGVVHLEAGTEVPLVLRYDMTHSLSTGAYGVTLGVDIGSPTRDAEADALARWADIGIVFASDRLLTKISKKTVVVLNTNSAVLMPWEGEVDAVLEAWYSGQQVGLAFERLLFGDVSPSGKLPLTFPRTLGDAVQISDAVDVPYAEGLYVGYRAYDANGVEPLFPFGHGLTYSNFSLSGIAATWDSGPGNNKNRTSVSVTATLRNEGRVDARQVVQLYVAYPEQAHEPPKLLKGFKKVALGARETALVELRVDIDDLKVWDAGADGWVFVNGTYDFMLGFSAGDILLHQELLLDA
ncbi:beta-glucosidase [Apiospora saccharicola]|uniref:beta-glucosidase n=1 Tax=Apiospora saccharicola TaxID=335842 RepID=A0ABR1V1J6_9PEZI